MALFGKPKKVVVPPPTHEELLEDALGRASGATALFRAARSEIEMANATLSALSDSLDTEMARLLALKAQAEQNISANNKFKAKIEEFLPEV